MKKDGFKKDIERAERIVGILGCVIVTISLCLLLNSFFLL